MHYRVLSHLPDELLSALVTMPITDAASAASEAPRAFSMASP
jgi:hypothetical protein